MISTAALAKKIGGKQKVMDALGAFICTWYAFGVFLACGIVAQEYTPSYAALYRELASDVVTKLCLLRRR